MVLARGVGRLPIIGIHNNNGAAQEPRTSSLLRFGGQKERPRGDNSSSSHRLRWFSASVFDLSSEAGS